MKERMTALSRDAGTTRAKNKGPLYVFFGHHKCATGWIDAVLRETCFNLGWRFRIVSRPSDFEPYGSLRHYIEVEKPNVLAYTNAEIGYLSELPSFRGFHVVRDPRDVITSGYFSHRYSHSTDTWPELAALRRQLENVSKEEGLFLEMEFDRPFLDQMYRWDYTRPDVLEVKLEALSPKPLETFKQIYTFMGFLDDPPQGFFKKGRHALTTQLNILNQRGRRFTPFGLPLSPFRIPLQTLSRDRVAAILERKSFKRMSGGRKHGEEDIKNHYRKGRRGDWRNHFNDDHIAYFKTHFNDLLIKLGYETNADW